MERYWASVSPIPEPNSLHLGKTSPRRYKNPTPQRENALTIDIPTMGPTTNPPPQCVNAPTRIPVYHLAPLVCTRAGTSSVARYPWSHYSESSKCGKRPAAASAHVYIDLGVPGGIHRVAGTT